MNWSNPIIIFKGSIAILPPGDISPSTRNCKGNPPAMTSTFPSLSTTIRSTNIYFW